MDVVDSYRASKSMKSLVGLATQGPVSFVLLVVPAAIAYVASFAGWFVSGRLHAALGGREQRQPRLVDA